MTYFFVVDFMSSVEGEFGGGCRGLYTVRAKAMRLGEQEVSEPGRVGGEWVGKDQPCRG